MSRTLAAPQMAAGVTLINSCPLCELIDISPLFPTVSVWKCPKCGMLFRNPPPTQEQLDDFYNNAFVPENVLAHRTGMEGTTSVLAEQYVSNLDTIVGVAGKSILEFGAGLGITCEALRRHGADVTAIEPFGWAECRGKNIPTYRSLADLPDKQTFDVVITLQVIEHLRSPWRTLEELRNRLTVGGWLYAATPNAASLRARLEGARWKEFRKYGHLLFYTPNTLALALKKAGFDRPVRVRKSVRYCDTYARNFLHSTLRLAGLEGELTFLAQRTQH